MEPRALPGVEVTECSRAWQAELRPDVPGGWVCECLVKAAMACEGVDVLECDGERGLVHIGREAGALPGVWLAEILVASDRRRLLTLQLQPRTRDGSGAAKLLAGSLVSLMKKAPLTLNELTEGHLLPALEQQLTQGTALLRSLTHGGRGRELALPTPAWLLQGMRAARRAKAEASAEARSALGQGGMAARVKQKQAISPGNPFGPASPMVDATEQQHQVSEAEADTTDEQDPEELEIALHPSFEAALRALCMTERAPDASAFARVLETHVRANEVRCARLMRALAPLYEAADLDTPAPPARKPMSAYTLDYAITPTGGDRATRPASVWVRRADAPTVRREAVHRLLEERGAALGRSCDEELRARRIRKGRQVADRLRAADAHLRSLVDGLAATVEGRTSPLSAALHMRFSAWYREQRVPFELGDEPLLQECKASLGMRSGTLSLTPRHLCFHASLLGFGVKARVLRLGERAVKEGAVLDIAKLGVEGSATRNVLAVRVALMQEPSLPPALLAVASSVKKDGEAATATAASSSSSSSSSISGMARLGGISAGLANLASMAAGGGAVDAEGTVDRSDSEQVQAFEELHFSCPNEQVVDDFLVVYEAMHIRPPVMPAPAAEQLEDAAAAASVTSFDADQPRLGRLQDKAASALLSPTKPSTVAVAASPAAVAAAASKLPSDPQLNEPCPLCGAIVQSRQILHHVSFCTASSHQLFLDAIRQPEAANVLLLLQQFTAQLVERRAAAHRAQQLADEQKEQKREQARKRWKARAAAATAALAAANEAVAEPPDAARRPSLVLGNGGGEAMEEVEEVERAEEVDGGQADEHTDAVSPTTPSGGADDKWGLQLHRFLGMLEQQLQLLGPAVWALDAEHTLAGLERYTMSRLHAAVFASRSYDVARDRWLSRRVERFSFLKLRNLDANLAAMERSGALSDEWARAEWTLAARELSAMSSFRTPSEKVGCILSCCKSIVRLLGTAHEKQSAIEAVRAQKRVDSDSDCSPTTRERRASAGTGASVGADDFLPALIYVVLRANPPQLHSNCTYIRQYSAPAKMRSEAGYYLTQLFSATRFIENLTHAALGEELISRREFDAAAAKEGGGEDEQQQQNRGGQRALKDAEDVAFAETVENVAEDAAKTVEYDAAAKAAKDVVVEKVTGDIAAEKAAGDAATAAEDDASTKVAAAEHAPACENAAGDDAKVTEDAALTQVAEHAVNADESGHAELSQTGLNLLGGVAPDASAAAEASAAAPSADPFDVFNALSTGGAAPAAAASAAAERPTAVPSADPFDVFNALNTPVPPAAAAATPAPPVVEAESALSQQIAMFLHRNTA